MRVPRFSVLAVTQAVFPNSTPMLASPPLSRPVMVASGGQEAARVAPSWVVEMPRLFFSPMWILFTRLLRAVTEALVWGLEVPAVAWLIWLRSYLRYKVMFRRSRLTVEEGATRLPPWQVRVEMCWFGPRRLSPLLMARLISWVGMVETG